MNDLKYLLSLKQGRSKSILTYLQYCWLLKKIKKEKGKGLVAIHFAYTWPCHKKAHEFKVNTIIISTSMTTRLLS